MTNRAYQLNRAAVTTPPPPLPPPQPLHGKYISLLPLADLQSKMNETNLSAMWQALYALSHGDAEREAVWEYMPYGPFADVAEMATCYNTMEKNNEAQFYIVQHENQYGGMVSYLRVQPASYSIEIGHIWHAPQYQRGRANTEAAFLLTDNAFDLGYRRMEWKCNAMNMRSRQAALRLGLAFEGVFRQCTVSKGKNRDTAWFAVLHSEWGAVKQNIQTWLDAPLGDMSLAKQNLPIVEWSLPAHANWEI